MDKIELYLKKRFGMSYMSMPSEKVKAAYPSHCVEYTICENIKDWEKQM